MQNIRIDTSHCVDEISIDFDPVVVPLSDGTPVLVRGLSFDIVDDHVYQCTALFAPPHAPLSSRTGDSYYASAHPACSDQDWLSRFYDLVMCPIFGPIDESSPLYFVDFVEADGQVEDGTGVVFDFRDAVGASGVLADRVQDVPGPF